MSIHPVRALPLSALRERTSEKWREYPPDVLPLFVAETDFPLAPAITATLRQAVERGDTGYTASHTPLADAYAGFARRRLGWAVDPAHIRSTADVSMGIVEILRRVTSPGDRVVVTPPVYPPFYELVAEAGGVVERVPLRDTGERWALDLDGLEAAFASGATAMLLCNPHNPTGTVHGRGELVALADIAARHGAAIISDEIHGPLTRAGIAFTPFLDASDAARASGYAVTSASKAFNLAGLKCALMITAHPGTRAVVQGMPVEVQWRTGQFGMLAATAAFSAESDEWLDGLLATLDDNRALLRALLTERLPAVGFREPDAGYLAWLDLRALGWGDNPSSKILREAKVALHFGPHFGDEGRGFSRLNFGCSDDVLREAVVRIAALTAA